MINSSAKNKKKQREKVSLWFSKKIERLSINSFYPAEKQIQGYHFLNRTYNLDGEHLKALLVFNNTL